VSTFTRAALAAMGMFGLGWVCPAQAEPPAARRAAGPIAPEQFGRVFRRAKPAIVQVRTSSSARTFEIGTFIGAEGELVFGARAKPEGTVWIRIGGKDRTARVLAYLEAASLAVARMEGGHGEQPLNLADPPDVGLDEWVIAVRFDAGGKLEPFAGTVDGTERPHTKDRSLSVVELGTPAQIGSPILTASGGLVAFAIQRGDRKTRAVLLSSLVPFLRQVVLGR